MLSSEEVKAIANLARLELNEEEIKRYGTELSAILEYVGALPEVDIKAEVKTNSGDFLRADEAGDWDQDERLSALGEAEEFNKEFIKVHRVLE